MIALATCRLMMLPKVEQELTTLLPFPSHSGSSRLRVVPCHDVLATLSNKCIHCYKGENYYQTNSNIFKSNTNYTYTLREALLINYFTFAENFKYNAFPLNIFLFLMVHKGHNTSHSVGYNFLYLFTIRTLLSGTLARAFIQKNYDVVAQSHTNTHSLHN